MKFSRGVGNIGTYIYALVVMALVMLCATLVYLVNDQASTATTQRTYSASSLAKKARQTRNGGNSFVTSLLSSELYLKAQKNPKSLTKEELQSFEAAPWLLPPGTDVFPWQGVTDIDKLVSLRSTPHGRYNKTIAVLMFTKGYALMTMNAIYTMVKFGKVDNYVLATLDDGNLKVCRTLNLPCMRAEHLLPFDMKGAGNVTQNASVIFSDSYRSITWSKPYIVKYLVDKNYAVLFSDGDVAFAPHMVWESYLRYIEDGHTDAAFQQELPINAGTYVVLPTKGGKRFMQLWTDAGASNKWHHGDQTGLEPPYYANYSTCLDQDSCNSRKEAMEEKKIPQQPRVRQYYPAGHPIDTYYCRFRDETSAPALDPCYWTVLHIHTICNEYFDKKPALDGVGFWFMDYRCDDTGFMPDGKKPCLPEVFSEPGIEDHFNSCRDYPLALTYQAREGIREYRDFKEKLKARRVNGTNVN